MTTADPYTDQLRELLGAVEVRAPDAYLWFGRREETGERAALVARLAERLERDWFGSGAPRPPGGADVAAPGDGGALVRALSQANAGRGAWQPGWRLGAAATDDDGGRTVVRPDGLVLVAPAADCRVSGAAVEVRLPKELRGWRPGTYVALGETPAGDGPRAGLYWNLAATGAATLVARQTYALNRAGMAFALELPAHPARYGRRDSALLCVAREDVPAALQVARPLLRALGAHLAEGAPALTKPLARGLAVAELPADDRSFAATRCTQLAEALVLASERGLRGVDERLAVVRDAFAAAGLNLATPYLEPGSSDAYALA